MSEERRFGFLLGVIFLITMTTGILQMLSGREQASSEEESMNLNGVMKLQLL
jgi:hypothetical protein